MSTTTERDIHSLPIFRLSDDELQERLRPAFESIMQETFAKGNYITYYDPAVCPTNFYMVHEYGDRKELVKLDASGKAHFIKTL